MTRARALKQAIRARAARTGERYTTARRHLLGHSNTVARAVADPTAAAPALKPTTRPAGMSEARFIAKTGHGFDHWFAVLDRFRAIEKGHTAAARHLREMHGIDGWYAQGITVAYERARGVRAVNQRRDGAFEVSVSKTVAGTVRRVITALTSATHRTALRSPNADLLSVLAKELGAPRSKGFVVRDDGLGRFRYRWGATTVQFYLVPKPGKKVTVTVTNMKLTDAAMVEERRGAWRAFLKSLGASLA